MDYIKLTCSNCGQHIEAPNDLRGESIPCPSCDQHLAIPLQSIWSMTKAQLTVLWAGLAVAALFTICQPVKLRGLTPKWSFTLIDEGLEDGTIPFLVRVAIATFIAILALAPRLRLNAAQLWAVFIGLTACFTLSLFRFDNPNYTFIFDHQYRLEANIVVLMLVCGFITAATVLSLRRPASSP